jgi:hypothetical protein
LIGYLTAKKQIRRQTQQDNTPPSPRVIPTRKSTLASLLWAINAESEMTNMARKDVPTAFCAE